MILLREDHPYFIDSGIIKGRSGYRAGAPLVSKTTMSASNVIDPKLTRYWTEQAKKIPSLRTLTMPRANRYWKHKPHPKQAAFLLIDKLEGMYGGAAGGGKSDALLMAALQYADVPGYAALLLRRTYGQLTKADSILDRAHMWLRGTDATWEAGNNRYVFPSGASLQFGYLQYFKDVYQYDGPAFQLIGFDELTHFQEEQYRFLFGRLRRLKNTTIPLRMRSATNPGGVGHVWVKNRFIVPGSATKDRFFVPATLDDNPSLDARAYRASLAMLDPVTRKQRESGDWDAVREGSIFKREWFEGRIIDKAPSASGGTAYFRVRYWDLAATAPKAGRDPDYTVGTLLARDRSGRYYVEDVQRFRLNPGDVEEKIYSTARLDTRQVRIRIEQEPGASGKSLIASYVRLLAGWDVRGIPSSGSKLARWMPFAAQCREGNVYVCNGHWQADWFDEILNVPDSDHDDQADSIAGAFSFFVDEYSAIRPGVSRLGGS